MLKPLIWGSQGPNWEEEEDQKSPWREQTPSISQSQNSNTTATTAAGGLGFKRELPLEEDRRNENLSSTSAPTPRPRGIYDPNRGSALLGPLSVNDPQLQPPDKISGGSGDRFILSESFFNIASPFGPFGAGNDWRVLPRDAPEHVHRLLRALVAAQDYAGAARALATLHRLHSAFDPDVYRYTVALLRLAGDHQKTSMYFRKVLGKKTRSISNASTLQARAIAHDFLSYLADAQKFDEAIHVSQNVLQSGSLSNHGAFKLDPSLKAHGAVLQLFAALLEHQACDCDAPSPKASSATTPPATAGAHGADGAGERWQRQQFSAAPPRVPRLQDPLSLIGQLRVCWAECSGGGGDSGDSGGGNGMRRRRPIATMPMLMPMRPPRPGTLWDHLYGSNPPWAPTDFGDRQGRGGGFGPGGGGCCGYDGTGGVFDGGAREAEKEAGGCPGFGSSPHPLLRGVDRELWEETVLDPGGEALLLVGTRGGGRARATVGEDSKTWCSDDEDCVSDDESELLQECARLASRRTGGCLYYSPPGGEEGFRARTGGEEGRGRGGGGGGGGGKSRVARQEALPFFETNVSAIVLEGM
ncbi:unnamed protein product, partial [Pylaiella littoralis]